MYACYCRLLLRCTITDSHGTWNPLGELISLGLLSNAGGVTITALPGWGLVRSIANVEIGTMMSPAMARRSQQEFRYDVQLCLAVTRSVGVPKEKDPSCCPQYVMQPRAEAMMRLRLKDQGLASLLRTSSSTRMWSGGGRTTPTNMRCSSRQYLVTCMLRLIL